MDMLENIKEALKILGTILTLSAAPDGLAKGIAVTTVILIACMLWRLLREFKSWREEQSWMAKDVRRLTIDTEFLVSKHCKLHDADTLELLMLRGQRDEQDSKDGKGK